MACPGKTKTMLDSSVIDAVEARMRVECMLVHWPIEAWAGRDRAAMENHQAPHRAKCSKYRLSCAEESWPRGDAEMGEPVLVLEEDQEQGMEIEHWPDVMDGTLGRHLWPRRSLPWKYRIRDFAH